MAERPKSEKELREQRLQAALRENLKRRKAQARGKAAGAGEREAALVVVVGSGELARRIAAACVKAGIGVRDAGGRALEARDLAGARIVVVASESLADKFSAMAAVRALDSRVAVVVAASNAGEQAWLTEFQATFICDALEGVTDAMMRAVRERL
jgi:hypothetical protein